MKREVRKTAFALGRNHGTSIRQQLEEDFARLDEAKAKWGEHIWTAEDLGAEDLGIYQIGAGTTKVVINPTDRVEDYHEYIQWEEPEPRVPEFALEDEECYLGKRH